MNIIINELEITAGDRRIYGKLYAPEKEGRYPAVILCHGYNGVNTDWVKECSYYAAHGYISYSFDFCGGSVRSKSSGKSTDMTVTTEKEDLLAVLDYIKAMDNVDEERIVLFGGSQGGLVAALAAAERANEVRALAMYFPAFCIPDNWKSKYPTADDAPEEFDFWGLTLGKGFINDVCNIDVFNTIGGFKGNVFILHGDKDDIVPFSYSERAVKTYEHAALIKMDNEGHGFSEQGNDKAKKAVLEFMDKECKN